MPASNGSQTTGEALVRALNARDLDAAVALCDPDGVAVFPHLREPGTLGTDARDYFAELISAFGDLRVSIRAHFSAAAGETQADAGGATVETLELRVAGTQSDDFLGIDNQEKYCDLDQAWRLTVSDSGSITRLRCFWDQTTLLRRLGVRRLDDITITKPGSQVGTPITEQGPHMTSATTEGANP